MTRASRAAGAVLLLLASLSCGIKAPPRPPLPAKPGGSTAPGQPAPAAARPGGCPACPPSEREPSPIEERP